MNLKAKVERDEKVPIKKVNNRTHFFERVHKTKEVRQQKSTKSIKHQKSSKSNEVKPTKKFKNAKELINLKEVKNTKEVKTHVLVFLLVQNFGPGIKARTTNVSTDLHNNYILVIVVLHLRLSPLIC